jgi:hypothetical protein
MILISRLFLTHRRKIRRPDSTVHGLFRENKKFSAGSPVRGSQQAQFAAAMS